MKTYGIYVCYPPTVDMRNEGLGRYLTAFIKGAENIEGVDFKIVCPSWSKDDLNLLFESEDVSLNKVSITAPDEEPIILKVFNFVRKIKNKSALRKNNRIQRMFDFAYNKVQHRLNKISIRLASSYKITSLGPAVFETIILFLIAIVIMPFAAVFGISWIILKKIRKNRYLSLLNKTLKKFFKTLDNPKNEGFVVSLYNSMVEAESERMLGLIKELSDVHAWYTPTAFWESFTRIDAPKLICVPDVVLTRFPGGFSDVGGERFFNTFKAIQRTINQNNYFVTYSDDVKIKTLVEHYNVDENNIYVIKHAPNRLDKWLEVNGFPDTKASTRFYAEKLLLVALSKQRDPYVNGIGAGFKFLFYASQLRPNKNVLTLLKAYNYLLKKKFINHKLVLTGTRDVLKGVSDYIKENELDRDVLFLSGLSVQELAACYKLADLSVNPTLSEGGCPFTFTESLSVDTPVVMGRIGVTEEVLSDPLLQDMTFFDPYDWMSIADKIEWALDNLDSLRDIQLETYQKLISRSWEDVVSEHIAAMNEVAERFHAERGTLIEKRN